MRRRSIYPERRIPTPSQLGGERMAAIQDACEFDLDTPGLDWAMWTVLKHDALLRGWRLDGCQHAMGLAYSLEEDTRLGSDFQIVCRAHGHDANPRATHYIFQRRGTMDIADWATGEREWLESVATWHTQTAAILKTGSDPRRPDACQILADPCLVRLAEHHGIDADTLLNAMPRFGRFIIGRGWYRTNPMPRVLEFHGIRAHVSRTAARLHTMRIGLGDGVSYSPPDPDRSRRVGILYTPRVSLSETMRNALIGEPLARIVEHPALDTGLRIRAVSKSGTGISVRVEGCEHPRPMSEGVTGNLKTTE